MATRVVWGLPSRRRIITVVLAITGLALLVYIVTSLYDFANLFGIFKPHSGIRISQEGVELLHNQTTPDPRPQVMPKILHQIFHNWKDPGNETLPAHWQEARQTCIDLNPDWEHKVSNSTSTAALRALLLRDQKAWRRIRKKQSANLAQSDASFGSPTTPTSS